MFISQNVFVLGHSVGRGCLSIDTSQQVSYCFMVAMLGEGARSSELLVAMITVAPDGGKCFYSTLVNECLNIQVDSVADTSTSLQPGMTRSVQLALTNGARRGILNTPTQK